MLVAVICGKHKPAREELFLKTIIKKSLIIISLTLTAVAVSLLGACNAYDMEESLKEQGYSCCITYDANGGTFGSNVTKTYALVKENSLAPAPGYVDTKTQASVKIPTRTDYELKDFDYNDTETDQLKKNGQAILSKSWYVAETDANGNVVYDESGNAVLKSNTAWDFTKDKVTEDITLVAAWKEVYKFVVSLQTTDKNGNPTEIAIRTYKVKPGDAIANKLYKKSGGTLIRRPDYINMNYSGYTLLDFYSDKDLKTPFDLDYVHPGTRENADGSKTNVVKIYVKYLVGKYEFVTQKIVDDKSLTLTETSKWYLLEDVDLTFNGAKKGWTALSEFNGEIYGNGYSISNFTVTVEPNKDNTLHSIFGVFNGKIHDLTLKNGELNVEASEFAENVIGEHRVSFIANKVSSEGCIDNLTVEDCVINLINGDKFDTTVNNELGRLFYENNGETLVYTVKADGEKVDYVEIKEKTTQDVTTEE